jgi:hypothetical protein
MHNSRGALALGDSIPGNFSTKRSGPPTARGQQRARAKACDNHCRNLFPQAQMPINLS